MKLMHQLITVILAAGAGTRMKSSIAKVAHQVCGQPLLTYVIEAVTQAGTDSLVLVLGHQAHQVKEIIPESTHFVIQQQQLGTGHAVLQTKDFLQDKKGTALVISGDMPIITGNTLKSAYEYHLKQGNQVTILTSDICFINIESLQTVIFQSDPTGQNEYSLSDIIKKMIENNQKTGTYKIHDPEEMMSVDDRIQLAKAECILLKRIIEKHMQNGVTFHLPDTCMIHAGVKIGRDTVIYPGTQLEGHTVIGEECEVGPHSRIKDGILGKGVHFAHSTMFQSQVGDHTEVGPFAYIRPGSKIGQHIKIGDFVEIKNADIGDNTKISHLAYIGDAKLGNSVNVGCGVIVVNYDGKKKNRTVVGDHAFIGCNVNLVSPVVVNDYAYIAAGSTITDEVPEYALAIARSRQTVIEDWVKKKGLDKK